MAKTERYESLGTHDTRLQLLAVCKDCGSVVAGNLAEIRALDVHDRWHDEETATALLGEHLADEHAHE
jgi:hypothetical protein